MEMHHRQPAKTHDSPLNNPPHINQSIFPNMLISIFLLYLSIYSIVNWCSYFYLIAGPFPVFVINPFSIIVSSNFLAPVFDLQPAISAAP